MTVVLLAYEGLSHHGATHAAGPTEADFIRWTGVLIAVAGTLVAAPSGVVHLYQAVTGTFALLILAFSRKSREGIGNFIGLLGKGFLWLAVEAIKRTPTEEPLAEIQVKPQIQWAESEPLEAKLELLRSGLEQAFEQISDVRQEARSADTELHGALKQVSSNLDTKYAELVSRMAKAEEQAATIDARGLPLVGLGIILTGIPDELAQIAAVGWVFVVISAVFLLSVLVALGLEWRGKRSPATTAVS